METQTVRMVRWPFAGLLAILSVITVLIWNGQPGVVLFQAPVAAYALIGLVRPPRLLLTSEGFEFTWPLRSGRFVGWDDIDSLFLGDAIGVFSLKGLVCWRFRRERNLRGPSGTMGRSVGVDGYLPWMTMPGRTLLPLMEAYRRGAAV